MGKKEPWLMSKQVQTDQKMSVSFTNRGKRVVEDPGGHH